ncbi:MAG TPA: hypothetical protein VF487_10185 [Chitinophagaceae bacterium]
MKKSLLFILVNIFSLYAFAQQSNEPNKDRIDSLAKDLCDCIMPVLDTLHPALKTMMTDMIEVGEDSAAKKFAIWYKMASEKDKTTIQQHILMLDEGEGMPVLKDCETKLEAKYPESVEQLQTTDSEFYRKLADYMMKNNKCKLLGAMLKLGSKKGGD